MRFKRGLPRFRTLDGHKMTINQQKIVIVKKLLELNKELQSLTRIYR